MTLVLDSKDLATIDKELKADSQVWDVLQQGAKSITEADFVGANEVRINKMSGFAKEAYKRNADNATRQISIEKETLKLKHEDWFSYSLDALDESESSALTIQNIVTEHRRLITIPNRDKLAIDVLLNANGAKVVTGTVDKTNALDAYDEAEAYALDNEVGGGFIMFASSGYYAALKNASGVNRSFTTNEQQLNGINRTVAQLDGSVPIIRVSKDRLNGLAETNQGVNFILVPLTAVAPVVKYGTVDTISASLDPAGYRDRVKGLDYYDAFVFENVAKSIYVSKSTPAA